MTTEIYGVLLHPDEYKYVEPLIPTIEEAVSHFDIESVFTKNILKVCHLAGFLKFRGKMRDYKSEMEWLLAMQQYIAKEFENTMTLLASMKLEELVGSTIEIGDLTLNFKG